MILYIFKSILGLGAFLIFYILFLEKEKMHCFNRFYLIGSVVFSLLIPTLNIYAEHSLVEFLIGGMNSEHISENPFNSSNLSIEKYGEFFSYFVGFYLVISSILLFRFIKNIRQISLKIRNNPKVDFKNSKLILLKEKVLPHTFLNYIFITQKDYESGKIEEELFTHEISHVSQKHTFDILILEFLQIIFWFNPFLLLLKRAVRLNHEYLADENTIFHHKNINKYQQLLLANISVQNHSVLSSNLNFGLTRKRLIMMGNTKSRKAILLKKLIILPVLIALVFLLSDRTLSSNYSEEHQSTRIENHENEKGKNYTIRNEEHRKAKNNK